MCTMCQPTYGSRRRGAQEAVETRLPGHRGLAADARRHVLGCRRGLLTRPHHTPQMLSLPTSGHLCRPLSGPPGSLGRCSDRSKRKHSYSLFISLNARLVDTPL